MARTSGADRARRLIAILGRFKVGTSIPLAELADEVGATPAELADDLETLSLCGVAPYSPEQMVDVFVEDGVVEVYTPLPAVRGPIRLSPAEAEALVAALGAAGFAADDPLTAKLMGAASASFHAESVERTLRTSAVTHETGVFETLADAVRSREAVRIVYQGEGASEPTTRAVEPTQLFADRGAWYVSAWCRKAGDHRTFRVDRVRGIERTNERFDPATRGDAAGAPRALATEGLPLARVRFVPGEEFVEREWPGGRVAEELLDGAVVAEIPYSGTDWVARRVVARLGRVEVLEPAEVRLAVAAVARAELAAL